MSKYMHLEYNGKEPKKNGKKELKVKFWECTRKVLRKNHERTKKLLGMN